MSSAATLIDVECGIVIPHSRLKAPRFRRFSFSAFPSIPSIPVKTASRVFYIFSTRFRLRGSKRPFPFGMASSDAITPAQPAANFDIVARPYRTIEWIVYGPMLEEARFSLLERWANARRLLLLGDGDGRCLARVLKIAPEATVVSVDASAAMLRIAAARLTPEERRRVEFVCADARLFRMDESSFDGIGTLFFMDCFEDSDARKLAVQLRRALRPGGILIYADFEATGSRLSRFWKRSLIGIMYVFFRVSAGLRTRALPNVASALEAAGFTETERRTWWRGFVRAACYRASEGIGGRS